MAAERETALGWQVAGPLSPAAASAMAQELLSGLPDRWAHTQSVARQAQRAASTVEAASSELLVAAAWLHDIGYAHELSRTGFHPLDGARHLERLGSRGPLVDLVAHHSCALVEAAERGLSRQLYAYKRPAHRLLDALTYADMTTGPTGDRVSVDQRIAEVLRRYSPADPVHRAITRAREDLLATVQRVEGRLAAHPPD